MIRRLLEKFKASQEKKRKVRETRIEFRIINDLIDKFREEGDIQTLEILFDVAEVYLDEIISMQ